MSQVTQGPYKTYKAGADLLATPKKYHVAKLTANDTITFATASTDVLVGIIQESVVSGDSTTVAIPSGGATSKAVCGENLSRGNYLTADSAGKLVRAYQTGDRVIAKALESGVTNDVIEVQMCDFRWVAGSSASPSVSPSASASLSASPSASESASRSPSASVSASVSPSASRSPSSSASPS